MGMEIILRIITHKFKQVFFSWHNFIKDYSIETNGLNNCQPQLKK